MIRSALAGHIISNLNNFPKAFKGVGCSIILSSTSFSGGSLSSYFFVVPLVVFLTGILSSYFFIFSSLGGTFSSYSVGTFLSYFPLPIFLATTVVQRDLGSFLFGKAGTQEPIGSEAGPDSPADWVEDSGGDGPRVAAYLRVSTGRQAKKGFSLEAQRDQLEKLKPDHKPSRIYWFIDAGKSGRDFDKRKLNAIMELKEKGEINELWVTNIDRIGRECRKLLLFFLNLCEDGVVIRTPEKVYGLKDLSSLLVYVIEAHGAEQKNKDRAKTVMAGKAQAFKKGHWNKPEPVSYQKAKNSWLEKIPDPNWDPLVKDTYAFLKRILFKPSFEAVKNAINEKYRGFLPKPLTRHQIKRILTDPVYMGKPQHLGEVVPDPSLAYVDEKIFMEAQKIVECIRKKHSRKNVDPIRDSLAEHGISALDFYDHYIELHHKGCGGLLVKYGTLTVKGSTKQAYLCKKCGWQKRVTDGGVKEKNRKWDLKQAGAMKTYSTGKFVGSPTLPQSPKKHTRRRRSIEFAGAGNRTLDEFLAKGIQEYAPNISLGSTTSLNPSLPKNPTKHEEDNK